MADLKKPVTAEKMRIYQREWRAKNAVRFRKLARKRFLLKTYGLTGEAVAAMMVAQDGHCAVCGVEFLERYTIDHDHRTGKVRALLCDRCNIALGMVDDSIPQLRALILYLEQHRPT